MLADKKVAGVALRSEFIMLKKRSTHVSQGRHYVMLKHGYSSRTKITNVMSPTNACMFVLKYMDQKGLAAVQFGQEVSHQR